MSMTCVLETVKNVNFENFSICFRFYIPMALHQVLSISLNFYIKHVGDDFPYSHKFPSSPFLKKSNFYFIVIISNIVWLPNKGLVF